MRVVDENANTITSYDLSLGNLVETSVIKVDAEPIDNVTKFAWVDEDYEDVLMYIPNHVEPDAGPSPQDDTDSMLVDMEYRLTLLELGLSR